MAHTRVHTHLHTHKMENQMPMTHLSHPQSHQIKSYLDATATVAFSHARPDRNPAASCKKSEAVRRIYTDV